VRGDGPGVGGEAGLTLKMMPMVDWCE